MGNSEWVVGFVLRFKRNANSLAARYGAPVFLVGGAVRCDEKPRDYDVRVVLGDGEFRRLFGDFNKERDADSQMNSAEILRAYDCLKQSRIASGRMKCCIDIQIQHESEVEAYKDLPRVRLDGLPDEGS